MIKTTRWRPDTCGCEIEFQWDDAVKDGPHSVHKINRSCPAHTFADGKDTYEAVLSENKRKNIIVSEIVAAHAVEPEAVGFAYNANRKLEIAVKGKSSLAIATTLAARVDAGEVIIK